MLDLITLCSARLATLLDGKTFDVLGSETQAPLAILPLGVQSKDDNEAPVAVVKLASGSDTFMAADLSVSITCVIYVNPDRDADGAADEVARIPAAMTDMETLVTSLRGMIANGNYSPYSLESVKWRIGDKDGLHPGPDYYEVSADLVFAQAAIA